jgi:hypothetical protein
MKPDKNEDRISRIMNDPEKVREAIQLGINDALLKHKQAGNSVCGWKDGKVYWVQPEDIVIGKKEDDL